MTTTVKYVTIGRAQPGLTGAHNLAGVNCDGVVDVTDLTVLAGGWATIYGKRFSIIRSLITVYQQVTS